MQFNENVDYEFVPDEGDSWQIRFLTGNYIETVIKYGTIRFNEGEQMAFDFKVISTPDEEVTIEDVSLQDHAADTLISIIEDSIKNKSSQLKYNEVK
jgi:hypothetical protein